MTNEELAARINALEKELNLLDEMIETFDAEAEALEQIDQSTQGLLVELKMAAEEFGLEVD
jgi:hypothetical protein